MRGDLPHPGQARPRGQTWGRTVDLQTLIAANLRGRSYRELGDDCGLKKQTIAQNAKPTPTAGQRFPTARTMRGLARGLDVDPESVGLAVLETMGVVPADRGRPALLACLPPTETLARLTPEDVDTVVRFVNLLADRQAARTLTAVPAASPGASQAVGERVSATA
jgi:hypothetical protein